jgi:hypothetical protein
MISSHLELLDLREAQVQRGRGGRRPDLADPFGAPERIRKSEGPTRRTSGSSSPFNSASG